MTGGHPKSKITKLTFYLNAVTRCHIARLLTHAANGNLPEIGM